MDSFNSPISYVPCDRYVDRNVSLNICKNLIDCFVLYKSSFSSIIYKQYILQINHHAIKFTWKTLRALTIISRLHCYCYCNICCSYCYLGCHLLVFVPLQLHLLRHFPIYLLHHRHPLRRICWLEITTTKRSNRLSLQRRQILHFLHFHFRDAEGLFVTMLTSIRRSEVGFEKKTNEENDNGRNEKIVEVQLQESVARM